MNTLYLYLLLLDPTGLAIQGGSKSIHSEQDSIILDWSMGQPASTELLNKGFPIQISTGFLQNKNCYACLFNSLDSFLISFKLGPNPVDNYLAIQLNQAGIVFQAVDIYTIEGKLLQRNTVNVLGIQMKYDLDYSAYPKGMYLLKFYFLLDDLFPIAKIIPIYKS
jgi:hypothetical protein